MKERLNQRLADLILQSRQLGSVQKEAMSHAKQLRRAICEQLSHVSYTLQTAVEQLAQSQAMENSSILQDMNEMNQASTNIF